MDQKEADRIGALIVSIRGLHPVVERQVEQLRATTARLEKERGLSLRTRSAELWKYAAYTDALVRIRLLIEQNLAVIEPLNVLAMTRYVFELCVWLKLLKQDVRYGSVYYLQLLEKQRDYWQCLKNHLTSEVQFLEATAHEEKSRLEPLRQKLARNENPDAVPALMEQMQAVSRAIDRQAARTFSLYGEDARTNGYSFQAYLVTQKALPKVEESITSIEKELLSAKQTMAKDPTLAPLTKNRWKWSDMAQRAGMGREYDFLYSYTSRLLHATPCSLTTDKKNLEPGEVTMFLSFVNIAFQDMIEMSKELCPPEVSGN